MLIDFLEKQGFLKSEVRRLLLQGAIKINGNVTETDLTLKNADCISVGHKSINFA
jgi:23S rRNA-/tRNA-specific pseudouridylate synthase